MTNKSIAFLTRTKGKRRLDVTDILTYLYLCLGTLIMFTPVIWGALSSFKTPASITRFPPDILPYAEETIEVDGFSKPLTLFDVSFEDGSVRRLAQVRRIGIEAQMVDPAKPDEILKIPVGQTEPVLALKLAFSNYTEPLERFQFLTFFRNSVIVTVSATLITLIINSMAAFALSKYRFRGKTITLALIIGTLMIPATVTLVPSFFIVNALGWGNTLIGIIIPTVATPTGVFLLRQYMLSLPDELLDAARIDGASEWRIYWNMILPLSAPALAVLAIFSIMWRWNDFLWPLIVLNETDKFTLQLGLRMFQNQFDIQWHFLLAMTVLTLLPITLIFGFLQRFITTGIASTGIK